MMETERLILMPLTYSQLLKYIRNDSSLDEELNLNQTSRTISVDLKEALEQTILPSVADTTKNYLYSTLWAAISKEEKKIVGDLCFVGEPNANGEIEIGYGTYEEYRRKGFMTEAVGGMIRWAEKQLEVRSIFAATEKGNIASHTVLEKNNFSKFGQTEKMIYWRLMIPKARV
ncbi:MAG: GNAT family N-acetyltransferase [Phaeodactylibacter sp.]|nr:GNAT family N-acetyltransferase [Phaeodactylibacter sp.]HQU61353.1 GNAT family N-acetyltransferase [Saprospiraceae bacterium]